MQHRKKSYPSKQLFDYKKCYNFSIFLTSLGYFLDGNNSDCAWIDFSCVSFNIHCCHFAAYTSNYKNKLK